MGWVRRHARWQQVRWAGLGAEQLACVVVRSSTVPLMQACSAMLHDLARKHIRFWTWQEGS